MIDINNVLFLYKSYIYCFFLCFLRWLIFIYYIPIFGYLLLPAFVKIILAMILSILTLFILPEIIIFDTSLGFLFLLILKEIFVGLFLGFLINLFFTMYEYSGQIIDTVRGANNAQVFIPQTKHQSFVIGSMLFQIIILLSFSLGWHKEIISLIFDSFIRFPIIELKFASIDDLWHLLLKSITHFFELSFRLAMPIIGFCLVTDLVFGLLNRISSQINAYFLSLPVKIFIGLIGVFCLTFFIIDYSIKNKTLITFKL